MTTRLLFKVLGEDGAAFHGGRGKWPLPTKNEDGTWTPGAPLSVTGQLVPCENGLHLARPADLIRWLGPTIYLVQVPEGVEEVEADDKIVVRAARLERRLETWNERTARHFACDCAERFLHLTTDYRPAEAIRIARLFADGLTEREELVAARAAAWTAAEAASWAAAGTAAWTAAETASGAAAWTAAGTASGAAAWTAAEAASWTAAWTAAEAAAAAGTAARAAEGTWQAVRLMEYLRGERP